MEVSTSLSPARSRSHTHRLRHRHAPLGALAALAVTLASAACDRNVYQVYVDAEGPDLRVSGRIGQQGGTLRVEDPRNPAFGTEVVVPPDAVSRDTELTIQPSAAATAPPATARAAGPVVQIAFAELDAPARVLLPFRIDAGPGERLAVLLLPEGAREWIELAATPVDDDTRRVSVETQRFGELVVVAVPAPEGPQDGGPGTDGPAADGGPAVPTGDPRPPPSPGWSP